METENANIKEERENWKRGWEKQTETENRGQKMETRRKTGNSFKKNDGKQEPTDKTEDEKKVLLTLYSKLL